MITLALEAQQLLLVLHLVELATVRALVVASGAVRNFLVPDVRRTRRNETFFFSFLSNTRTHLPARSMHPHVRRRRVCDRAVVNCGA